MKVMQHLSEVDGVRFDTVSAMNEPSRHGGRVTVRKVAT